MMGKRCVTISSPCFVGQGQGWGWGVRVVVPSVCRGLGHPLWISICSYLNKKQIKTSLFWEKELNLQCFPSQDSTPGWYANVRNKLEHFFLIWKVPTESLKEYILIMFSLLKMSEKSKCILFN